MNSYIPQHRVGLLESHFRDICEHVAADIRRSPSEATDAVAVSRAMDMLLAVVSSSLVRNPSDRTDEFGRARAGSQLQMQLFVNLFPDELNAKILEQLPELAAKSPTVDWVSPVAADGYREYRDGQYLAKLGLEDLQPKLKEFWPDGGPRWDGLAVLRFADAERPGVLLVEAKAHVSEVAGSGCQAGEASRKQIERSLMAVAGGFGLSSAAESWLGGYYQSINRIAHLLFLKEQGVDAWLANVYFADDWYKPTSEETWRSAIHAAKDAMAIQAASIPRAADVVVPAKKLLAQSLPAE